MKEKPEIFLATPMFGGICDGEYTSSMMQAVYNLAEMKRKVLWRFRYNDPQLTSARNMLVDEFLDSTAEYLLFIDADISFNFNNLEDLILCAESRKDIGILCGPYPYKNKNDFPFEIKEKIVDPYIPVRANLCGAGFMLIRRRVFDQFRNEYPEQGYRDIEKPGKDLFAYFDFKIKNQEYLGEDLMFTRWCEKIGIDTWLLPAASVTHRGNSLNFMDFYNSQK
jgi:hypothetical protein